MPLEELSHELYLFELPREFHFVGFEDRGLLLDLNHQLGHALFKHLGDLGLDVLCIRPYALELLLYQVDLVMYERLLILKCHIVILSFIQCIVIRDLYVYQVVVPPILLSETSQYAL